MTPLKLGIVGAGGIAQRNATEAARSGAAEIAGVFDVNHTAAREMARRLKAPFFSSYEALLEAPGLEAVLLSVPHHLHRPMTVQAARVGKHVLVEKPIANTLAEADEMIAACQKSGVLLTVNYSFRYLPRIIKARALIDAGILGTVTGIHIMAQQFKDRGYWAGAQSNSPDDWRASKEKCGGGFLIMTMCHALDYVYYVTGLKATRVYAEYGTLGSPAQVEDIISISFQMQNGAVGNLCGSSIMRGFPQAEERIWGSNGSMVISGTGIQVFSTRPVDGKRPGEVNSYTKFPETSWTADWIRAFVNAVRTGGDPPIGPREGWENLAFITSAYEAMDRGAAQRIPMFDHQLEVARA